MNVQNNDNIKDFSYHVDYSYIKRDFGQRILELRKERNLNQGDVANALGISRVALGYYERGERTADIEFVLKAADLYKVSPNYLLGKGPRNAEYDDLTLYDYFSEKSIDFLLADHVRSGFLDEILSHEDIGKAADLIYMTHYKPLMNKYETRFNAFLLTQMLYNIISDVAEEAYSFEKMTDAEKKELLQTIEEYRAQRNIRHELTSCPPKEEEAATDWWSYFEDTYTELDRLRDRIVSSLNKELHFLYEVHKRAYWGKNWGITQSKSPGNRINTAFLGQNCT
jgi:transcriptional regulator with XRE-family HTH domain